MNKTENIKIKSINFSNYSSDFDVFAEARKVQDVYLDAGDEEVLSYDVGCILSISTTADDYAKISEVPNKKLIQEMIADEGYQISLVLCLEIRCQIISNMGF